MVNIIVNILIFSILLFFSILVYILRRKACYRQLRDFLIAFFLLSIAVNILQAHTEITGYLPPAYYRFQIEANDYTLNDPFVYYDYALSEGRIEFEASGGRENGGAILFFLPSQLEMVGHQPKDDSKAIMNTQTLGPDNLVSFSIPNGTLNKSKLFRVNFRKKENSTFFPSGNFRIDFIGDDINFGHLSSTLIYASLQFSLGSYECSSGLCFGPLSENVFKATPILFNDDIVITHQNRHNEKGGYQFMLNTIDSQRMFEKNIYFAIGTGLIVAFIQLLTRAFVTEDSLKPKKSNSQFLYDAILNAEIDDLKPLAYVKSEKRVASLKKSAKNLRDT